MRRLDRRRANAARKNLVLCRDLVDQRRHVLQVDQLSPRPAVLRLVFFSDQGVRNGLSQIMEALFIGMHVIVFLLDNT